MRACRQLAGLLLALLLHLLLHQHPASAHQPAAGSITPEACAATKYQPLYTRIDRDLRHWRAHGISQALMDQSLHMHGQSNRHRGVGILFERGVPHLLTNLTSGSMLSHQLMLVIAHLRLFEALGRVFGSSLPDVEFVLGFSDEPSVRLDEVTLQDKPCPVLRYCKSEQHADILVPYIHFQLKRYNESLLSKALELNSRWKWEDKRQEVFARFSNYRRHVHVNMPGLERKGARGVDICWPSAKGLMACDVRWHFMLWAEEMRNASLANKQGAVHDVKLNVARQPRVSMLDHAAYKYLLHLDGQSCSSRLEQLLVLNSLVLKEESGYVAFYHHLLKEYKHYLPVWRQGQGPEDVLDAVRWAREHDEAAQQVAQNAQQVALEFLSPEAISCYWYTVLVRLASLLTYKPSTALRAQQHSQPVHEFLASHEGKALIARFKLQSMELP